MTNITMNMVCISLNTLLLSAKFLEFHLDMEWVDLWQLL